ncbi:MAG: heme-binding protein [Bdellovibrionales bacterium]|nr:heme-binding protein [Bdellovibrionales bacterium]
MKKWTLFALFFLFLNPGAAMAIEEPKFSILLKEDDFELRNYEPVIVAETEVTGDFEGSGNEGFRRLAGYIFGGNRQKTKIEMTAPVNLSKGQKIEMTAPVGLSATGAGKFLVSFTMPASFTLETLPAPNDEQVKLRLIPAHKLAVLRYSGTWSEERYRVREEKLRAWIKSKNLKESGPANFARFNAPFTPWFLRRNEVQIPVE